MLNEDRQRKLDLLLQIAAIGLVAAILFGFFLKVLFI
jgi:hypothetical protein